MSGIKVISRASIIKRVLDWMPEDETEYELQWSKDEYKIKNIKSIKRDI